MPAACPMGRSREAYHGHSRATPLVSRTGWMHVTLDCRGDLTRKRSPAQGRRRRAISVPLTPVKTGVSRSLADNQLRRSGHTRALEGTDSQADSAAWENGLAAQGMRVEMRVASPEPAVEVFTPAGTYPGRLRRHCVIGCADPGQDPSAVGPAAVGFGEGPGQAAARSVSRCRPGSGDDTRTPRPGAGHDRRRRCPGESGHGYGRPQG